jgi:hypothetical protein
MTLICERIFCFFSGERSVLGSAINAADLVARRGIGSTMDMGCDRARRERSIA